MVTKKQISDVMKALRARQNETMTPEERSAKARKAVQARWNK